MLNKFYKLSLRHMGKNDNCFLFWGHKGNGYYRSVEDAGEYENTNEDSKGDPLVSLAIVEKYKQKIVLPKYGDTIEKYANKNEFFVLPNTGEVRKALGITTLDIHLDGNRNSFNARFKDTISEKFKLVYSSTDFNIKGKEECFDEWWYCDEIVESSNRNKAIYEVFKEGLFGLSDGDCSFIEFKKKVTCKRVRETVFEKWI